MKMALDHGYIVVSGIFSVALIECVALFTGHDGQVLLTVIAAISALAGASGGIAVKTWAQGGVASPEGPEAKEEEPPVEEE
jgi:hypothetical protein